MNKAIAKTNNFDASDFDVHELHMLDAYSRKIFGIRILRFNGTTTTLETICPFCGHPHRTDIFISPQLFVEKLVEWV